MESKKTYFGFVPIIGRSNVGKSTLLNKLLGHKISITSCKPKTTVHCISGIRTEGNYQVVYIDTPGTFTIQKKFNVNYITSNLNNKSIFINLKIVVFIVESIIWTLDDELLLNNLYKTKVLIILGINKIDNLKKKNKLLPHINFLAKKVNFLEIIPISAKNGTNISNICNAVHKYLPEGIHHFSKDYITDSSRNFIVSEIIREKLMRFLGAELSYSSIVKIEDFSISNNGSYDINGIILVEKEIQKRIVIGNKGNKIKTISLRAREDIQRTFKAPVYLRLWVKIKSN